MLMRGGYCRLKNLTHKNSQTLAALGKGFELVLGEVRVGERPGLMLVEFI